MVTHSTSLCAMQYVCLCYTSEAEVERLPRHELEAINIGQVEYDAELRKSGHAIAAEAREPVAAATTIPARHAPSPQTSRHVLAALALVPVAAATPHHVRNGHLPVPDGPDAETKEQPGGCVLLEPADLTDAIRTASRLRSVRYGSMEIRAD